MKIDDLKDVFELAATTGTFINELMKIKSTSINNNRDGSKIKSSGDWAQVASSGHWFESNPGYFIFKGSVYRSIQTAVLKL